ncbi:septum site-determining protein MinC [Pantoea sp. SoEX]|uniref:septum site-determining protein MinC n=1 Tax=Pantoea sp. SoEX TaxID=2576763 RepID=UPI00135BBEA1|nr:septum site-determining protein MinC [Pantoea sp. SoEX]MXP50927.1 septum site-determining protein MinC [Pantoea sp. SoEX]
MSQQLIKFKDINFRSMVLYLYNHEPELILKAIENKFIELPNFTKNLPVILNIDALNLNKINLKHITQSILSTGLCIIGIISCKEIALIKTINSINLPILTETKKSYDTHNELSLRTAKSVCIDDILYNKTRVINLHVRSGQQVYSGNADLVILGNVSSGAEVVSDRNIHIYGIMRGRALAGAKGDNNCYIFCSNLSAELISIAGKYWVMDQIPKKFSYTSSCIYLKKGMLTIQKIN